jgi:hypothetical protein
LRAPSRDPIQSARDFCPVIALNIWNRAHWKSQGFPVSKAAQTSNHENHYDQKQHKGPGLPVNL